MKMDYEEINLCKNCGCMTKTKKGTIYICGKCGKDRRRNENDKRKEN